MKKNLLFLLVATTGFFGCSDNTKHSDTKSVTYQVVMEPSTNTFVLKGEYRDAAGKMVSVDTDTPWQMELKNVPSNFKAAFNGYLFNINTNTIKGKISMKVVDAEHPSQIITNKTLTLDKYNNSGYTAEELKQDTSFTFFE